MRKLPMTQKAFEVHFILPPVFGTLVVLGETLADARLAAKETVASINWDNNMLLEPGPMYDGEMDITSFNCGGDTEIREITELDNDEYDIIEHHNYQEPEE